jgi:hypothetical protein
MQVGRLSFLGRGCIIRTGAMQITRRRGKTVNYAVVTANEVMQNQSTLTTHLPVDVDLVAIHVEMDSSATTREIADGLGVSVGGLTLKGAPVSLVEDNSVMLVYTVAGRDEGAIQGSIGTTTAKGWRVTGVMGMRGGRDEWLRRLSKGSKPPLIENGPLTATGVSKVVFRVDDPA